MNTIDIAVIALPDGTVIHCEDHPSIIRKEIDAWKDVTPTKHLEEYDKYTIGGLVKIRMLKRDWKRMKRNAH